MNFLWFLLIPIAYLMYVLSLLIVGTELNRANLLFTHRITNPKLRHYRKKELLRNLLSSTSEELIYRGIVQYYLNLLIPFPLPVIILSSAFFTAQHNNKKIALVQMIDVAVFSLLITILFQSTQSIYFVTVVHIARNYFIILQKYIHSDINC